jgi:hypothetical protein
MAVQSGLELPEILSAIFEQLHPADDFYDCDGELIVTCSHRVHDAAGLTALGAAARVSRLWFAVAVPILWQHPLQEALDDAAIPDAARRAFYAQHIRVVDISWPSPLWRALSRAPGASMPGMRGAGMERSAASAPTGGAVEDSLRLPKLASLRIDAYYWWERNLATFSADQAALLWLIGPGLQTLKCQFAPELFDRLEAVKEQLLQSGQGAKSPLARLSEPVQQPYMGLRHLHLEKSFGRGGGAHHNMRQRLLAWLESSRTIAPMLTSVSFDLHIREDEARRALLHLATHDAITGINFSIHYMDGFSNFQLVGNAATCGPGSCVCRVERCQAEQVFERLECFRASVEIRAVPSLVVLMPSLTHISLCLYSVEKLTVDSDAPRNTNALKSLSQLSKLKTLGLRGEFSIMPSDLRLLHGLKQLRTLDISTTATSSATDEDLVVLLRSLPRLHTLRYEGDMPHLSQEVLRSIGLAGPLLRHIELPCRLFLPLTSEQPGPLFPMLETLTLWPEDDDDMPQAR